MNRQASILFDFISSSISGNSLALQETSAQHSYYQRLIYASLTRSIYTTEGFYSLARQLADIARHAYLAKQISVVEQASQIILALPVSERLRSIARHYQALCAKRKGDFDGARKLLESLITETLTPQYKSRALQVIGATYYECGEIDAALPFYIAAGKAAIDHDPLTLVDSQAMIAVVRSIHGDHKQALDDLERLFPLVRAIGKHYPTVYYDYLNSLAVELGEVGRVNEAQRVCQITLASPFAQAYPNWLETRDELEAKSTSATPSVVAVSTVVELAPSPQVRQQCNIKLAPALAFIKPARESAFIQISIAIAFTVIAHNILEQVHYSIIPRGPPACF